MKKSPGFNYKLREKIHELVYRTLWLLMTIDKSLITDHLSQYLNQYLLEAIIVRTITTNNMILHARPPHPPHMVQTIKLRTTIIHKKRQQKTTWHLCKASPCTSYASSDQVMYHWKSHPALSCCQWHTMGNHLKGEIDLF